jgi:hypothetical protein
LVNNYPDSLSLKKALGKRKNEHGSLEYRDNTASPVCAVQIFPAARVFSRAKIFKNQPAERNEVHHCQLSQRDVNLSN